MPIACYPAPSCTTRQTLLSDSRHKMVWLWTLVSMWVVFFETLQRLNSQIVKTDVGSLKTVNDNNWIAGVQSWHRQTALQ